MNRYNEIYRIENIPVTQNMMFDNKNAALNCTRGDAVLVQDMETGLIFNNAFKPELFEYNSDYQNEQAISLIFKMHLEQVMEIIQSYFWGKSLIEIGCGKGYLLERLVATGFGIKGFDPAYEGTNPLITKSHFNSNSGICADAIILRHVLEHIENPIGFLYDIKRANGGGGLIYIEVPCFDWICSHSAWFDIYYEHVNYFRLKDFYRMFKTVLNAGYCFGRQYLFVIADLATLRIPELGKEKKAVIPDDFLAGIKNCIDIIRFGDSKQLAVWGAASKGVIFTLFMQRNNIKIDWLIDINPAKQGKYIGGSGVFVESPEDALKILKPESNIFITNSNYLLEIISQSGNKYNYLEVTCG